MTQLKRSLAVDTRRLLPGLRVLLIVSLQPIGTFTCHVHLCWTQIVFGFGQSLWHAYFWLSRGGAAGSVNPCISWAGNEIASLTLIISSPNLLFCFLFLLAANPHFSKQSCDQPPPPLQSTAGCRRASQTSFGCCFVASPNKRKIRVIIQTDRQHVPILRLVVLFFLVPSTNQTSF